MKSLLKSRLQISLVLILVLMALSHAATLEETLKKSFPFQPGGRVEVENVNGNITIESWDKNEVYVEAEKRVRAGGRKDAERFMEALNIEIEQRDNEIIIITRHPRKGHAGFWDWVFGENVSSEVAYKINVPKRCDVEATSTNGGIYISYVEGSSRLRTTNGKIDAVALKGLVSARTTNGSVKVELKEVTSAEEMEFLTTNGSVTLYIPNNIDCDVRAKTTNGSIKTDFPLEVRGKYGSKSVQGKINSGGPLIFIETTNGSIKLLET